MNHNFLNLFEFLQHSESEFKLFELGRQIRSLDPIELQRFESSRQPWPWPYLQQAWLGLVFWGKNDNQAPQVWCMRFPLDEQGLLPPDQLNLFIAKLKGAIAENLKAAREGTKLRALLDGNPFSFDLSDDRKAAFHAIIKTKLNLAPSDFYAPALSYFQNLSESTDGWEQVGLQGIADICARSTEPETERILQLALPLLPDAPLYCVCQCLEHQAISEGLATALSKIISTHLNDAPKIASALRAMSLSPAADLRQQDILAILRSDISSNAEILTTLATRCSADLQHETLTLPYLEALAQLPTAAFKRIMSEILFQPGMRQAFMQAFRATERSERLGIAIGTLLN